MHSKLKQANEYTGGGEKRIVSPEAVNCLATFLVMIAQIMTAACNLHEIIA
jgi:hypothetical protein